MGGVRVAKLLEFGERLFPCAAGSGKITLLPECLADVAVRQGDDAVGAAIEASLVRIC